jgi:hypothetical protein
MHIKFRKFQDCVLILEKNNNNLYHSNKTHVEIPIEEVSLQANFYYLELEERKKLALKEYEITPSFPLQRWEFVVISVSQNYMDLYLTGLEIVGGGLKIK